MILFYLILFCIPLYKLQFAGKGFQQDYLSVQQTNVIKGIFIWIVFFNHITPYITQLSPFTSPLDTSVFTVQKLLGQLIVVPFLFYSGYGVMLSIMKKPAYLTSIPKKRIPVTFLNFAVAVLFFVALNLTLDISMTPKQILLSLLMWDSVGNSNWYIFTICFCYFASYVAFSICKNPRKGLKLLTLILLVFAVGMSFVKEGWWYDTCLAYAAGSYFACYKERMEGLLRRHYAAYITIFGGVILASLILKACIPDGLKYLAMNVCSVFFALFVVSVCFKVKLNSRLLEWSGKHLFPLYIYQRIPMTLLATVMGGSLVVGYKYLYVVACMAIVILITTLYKYIAIKL